MKKLLTVAIVAAISSTAFCVASDALAQASAPVAAAKPAAKPAAAHSASAAKTASGAHVVKHKVIKKKAVVVAEKKEIIPEGADKWSCAEDHTLYIKGDMKRDQILTMFYEGKSYQLPRRQTTTGADRFYDMASGMDLVVIPTKAMLFSDKEDDRLADECKTDAMLKNNELAPTQSNAILKR